MRIRLDHAGHPDRVDVSGFVASAAGPVHPPGDHVEHMTEPLGDRACQVHRNTGAGDGHRGVRAREVPCHSLDIRTGDVAAGREVVEVDFGDQLAQFVYARCEFGAVLFVLEAFVEDDLDHGEQQRPILSGSHRKVYVGVFRRFGPQRVDDDDLRAALLPFERAPPSAGHGLQPIPCADSGIRADQQEVVAVVDIGHRGHQHRAVHRGGDDVHRVLVDGADEVAAVGADGVQPPVHEDDVRRRETCRVSVVDADRVGPVGVDERVHACCDVGDGFVPGCLDIGVADATHRVHDAARMLDELVGGAALGAEVPPGVGVLLVRGDLRDAIAVDRHLDAARRQAVPAERVHRLGTHSRHSARPTRPWVALSGSPTE